MSATTSISAGTPLTGTETWSATSGTGVAIQISVAQISAFILSQLGFQIAGGTPLAFSDGSIGQFSDSSIILFSS